MRTRNLSRYALTFAVLTAMTATGGVLAADKENAQKQTPGRIVITPEMMQFADVTSIEAKEGEPKVVISKPVSSGDLPFAAAVSEEELAPYTGRTVSGIHIVPMPEPNIENEVGPLLALRKGDAFNVDYVKHDINVVGSLGIYSEITPQITETPEGIALTYAAKVNPVVHKVTIEGNTLFDDAQLRKYLGIEPNMVLNMAMLSERIAKVNDLYNQEGYMLARIQDVNLLPDGELKIKIIEGHIENIEIKGNTKTKDRVIRRELRVKEGDVFNKNTARRSVERVYNTGYFEDVNIKLAPGSDQDKINIEIDVIEQKTGTITVGAGYSESDGMIGIVELGETNFRGTGDKVNSHWEFGGNSDSNKNYVFSYTRPWLDDKGTSLGFSLFDRKYEYDDYDSNGSTISTYDRTVKGYSLTLGRVTSEYTTNYFTWESKDTVYDGYVSGLNYNDYPEYMDKNFGRTNSLTWSRVFDNRDNVFDPSRGHRFSHTLQWAGNGLGGDFDYFKYTIENRLYKKVGHSHVLALRLMAGIASGDLPYNDLFLLGGPNNLRGYEDDQFRGDKMYAATLEYRFPVMNKVQGALFTDVGSTWGGTDNVPWYQEDKSLQASVGAGLRITTPIGPVRLDYAVGTEGGKFHFSFGGKF